MYLPSLVKFLFRPKDSSRELEVEKDYGYEDFFLAYTIFSIPALLLGFLGKDFLGVLLSLIISIPLLVAFAGGITFSLREESKKSANSLFVLLLTVPCTLAYSLFMFLPPADNALSFLLPFVGVLWSLLIFARGIEEISGVSFFSAVCHLFLSSLIVYALVIGGFILSIFPSLLISIAFGGV
jgi:hypothetical protein